MLVIKITNKRSVLFSEKVNQRCEEIKYLSICKGDVHHNRTTLALVFHCIDTGHDVDFDGVKIWDQVSYKKQREFGEMLNIHFFTNTLNRIQDTMFLKNSFKKIVGHINDIEILRSITSSPISLSHLLTLIYQYLSKLLPAIL